MKICLPILMLLFLGNSWSQISITEMYITPSNPSDTDSIYLVTTMGSWNTPLMEIDYSVTDYGDSINVGGCYSTGFMNAGDFITHVYNLGVKSAGLYKINFTLYGTPDWDSCTYFFMEQDSIIFNVGYTSLSNQSESNFKIYPNPISDGIINIESNTNNESYQIYNSIGELVQAGKTETQINVGKLQQGLYFFVLMNGTKSTTEKLIIE